MLREKGTVKWFNSAKGYGFIQRHTGEDVFVHHSTIQMSGYRTLSNGTTVEFEVREGPKGLHAENVTSIEQNNELRERRQKARLGRPFPRADDDGGLMLFWRQS